MTKSEFVSRAMSDMAKRKRERIRAVKNKDKDYMSVAIENHYRIKKRGRQ